MRSEWRRRQSAPMRPLHDRLNKKAAGASRRLRCLAGGARCARLAGYLR
ncbi:hypothetical protein GLA29479_2278 [Lysobacter antibioticus]|nr:hypothetical protein GLA29479_2278 [Lysobacter antibioticus]